jgi:hypothetical protein
VAFILLFVIGESVDSKGSPSSGCEWVGLALFPFGVCPGLLAGRRRQLHGAALSLGCLAGFSIWLIVVMADSDVPPPILVFAIPAILCLVYACGTRKAGKVEQIPQQSASVEGEEPAGVGRL